MCYQSPSTSYNSDYDLSNSRKGADKRGSKNLFKTALDRLTSKHKERNAVSDNVYEVIVIYKDKDDTEHSHPSSKYTQCQDITINTSEIKDEPPKAPPRSRSRTHSRNSCKNYAFDSQSPTVRSPPRSRPQSQSSCKTFPVDNPPPTPPPRSRPQSRNSFKSIVLESNRSSFKLKDFQNDEKSELHKPPISPPRSQLIKERIPIPGRITQKNKSVRKSVSLTDLENVLDNKDIEEKEDTDSPHETPTSAMVGGNDRMDSRWAKVMSSSSNSLSMSENSLGQHMPAWKKGSFADIQKIPSKTSPCSPVSPPSPPSSHSKCKNNLKDNPLPPLPPTHSKPKHNSGQQQQQPYLGWRSQGQLPTFLPTDSPGRMEGERNRSRQMQAGEKE